MITLSFVLGLLCFQDPGLRGFSVEKAGQPAYKALLIGINRYQDSRIAQLVSPEADVLAIAEVLERRFYFEKPVLLLNENATEAGIRDAIQTFVMNAKPEDNLLIYFAGHGEKGESLSGYWLPHDSKKDAPETFISNHDIEAYLKGSKARHVFLIADSCFAGSMFLNSQPAENPLAYAEKYRNQSRWALTAGNLEPVLDTQTGTLNSVFANALLQCLNQKKEAYLTPSEILQTVSPLVSLNSGRKQLPRVDRLPGDKGGSFVFWNREGVRRDGGPAPPPWENPESDMVYDLKSKLGGRKVWVVNGNSAVLCQKLEQLGMVVDCDNSFALRPAFSMALTTFCGQISSETIAALRDYLGLSSYALNTHQNDPRSFQEGECGSSWEVTIWN